MDNNVTEYQLEEEETIFDNLKVEVLSQADFQVSSDFKRETMSLGNSEEEEESLDGESESEQEYMERGSESSFLAKLATSKFPLVILKKLSNKILMETQGWLHSDDEEGPTVSTSKAHQRDHQDKNPNDETASDLSLSVAENCPQSLVKEKAKILKLNTEYLCNFCTRKLKSAHVFAKHLFDNHSKLKVYENKILKTTEIETKLRLYYHCVYCSFKSTIGKNLQEHILTHLKRDTIATCVKCSYECCDIELYKSHLLEHENVTKREKLKEREEKKREKLKLREEVKLKHREEKKREKFKEREEKKLKQKEEKLRCATCSYKADSFYKLKIHVLKHKGAKTFTCPKCEEEFASKSYLNYHLKERHETRTLHYFKSQELKKETEREKLKEREEKLRCPTCSFKGETLFKLKIHIKKHKGEKTFTCPKCENEFASKSYFLTHLKGKHQIGTLQYFKPHKEIRKEELKQREEARNVAIRKSFKHKVISEGEDVKVTADEHTAGTVSSVSCVSDDGSGDVPLKELFKSKVAYTKHKNEVPSKVSSEGLDKGDISCVSEDDISSKNFKSEVVYSKGKNDVPSQQMLEGQDRGVYPKGRDGKMKTYEIRNTSSSKSILEDQDKGLTSIVSDDDIDIKKESFEYESIVYPIEENEKMPTDEAITSTGNDDIDIKEEAFESEIVYPIDENEKMSTFELITITDNDDDDDDNITKS